MRTLCVLLTVHSIAALGLPALATRSPGSGIASAASRGIVQRGPPTSTGFTSSDEDALASTLRESGRPVGGDSLAVSPRAAAPPPPFKTGGAVPLLSVEASNQTLSLNPTALNAISRLPAPVCMLAVTGAAHDGKSSWLNMFSHWVGERWATEGPPPTGGDFKVAHGMFDSGTEGAWLKLMVGKDGAPLPGTECASLALVDTQGQPRGLDSRLASGAALGAERIFTLSRLAASTLALNLMAPLSNQLSALRPALTYARGRLPEDSPGADAPNLVLLERDARPARRGPTRRSSASEVQIEYDWLRPRGDALDGARDAVRALFVNRTLVQIRQPEAADRDALSHGGLPARHAIEGLPEPRPFYASFAESARATLGALRPKAIGGHALHGDEIADMLQSLVHQLNADAAEPAAPAQTAAQTQQQPAQPAPRVVPPILLQSSVHDMLREKADAAVAAGVRAGHRAFSRLLPFGGVGAGDRSARRAPSRTRLAAVAYMPPSSMALSIRNATQAALAAFAAHAPRFGAREDGLPGAWLQPYVKSLLSEMRALEREARREHEHSRQLHAAYTLGAEHAAGRELPGGAAAGGAGASWAASERPGTPSPAEREAARSRRRKELLGNVIVFTVGACASMGLGPPALLARLTPLVGAAPTALAAMGVWRVAQRPLLRWAGAALSGARVATDLVSEAMLEGGRAVARRARGMLPGEPLVEAFEMAHAAAA